MFIRVGSRLVIKDPTEEVVKYCKERLILSNPEYHKKERMGLWLGNTPEYLWLYESFSGGIDGAELWLPFGCVNDIWRMHPVKEDYQVEIEPIKPRSYESEINLYEYQQKAVDEALRKRNGVLVMPCGSGKTQCGLEIIARIGGRALWLTHTQDLLNQSKARAESVLAQGGYGTITGGKVNMGSHITFATVQTLSKLDLSDFHNAFDAIICDECQHAAGSPTKVTQFYKVISRLSARYKIGLTATPKRSDGLERSMFALLGEKIHEVTREEVAHTTCPVRVMMVKSDYFPNIDIVLAGDGTLNYARLVDDLTHNEDRMNMVLKYIPHGSATMVLGNRIEYLQNLQERYAGRSLCLSGMGHSKKAKEERKEALRRLNEGELECIFATYQLAKEGLDVPNLRYVVFATPEKDETTVVQAAGRVARKFDGKQYGTVIDFEDNFGMFHGWARKRERFYKKLGYEKEDV